MEEEKDIKPTQAPQPETDGLGAWDDGESDALIARKAKQRADVEPELAPSADDMAELQDETRLQWEEEQELLHPGQNEPLTDEEKVEAERAHYADKAKQGDIEAAVALRECLIKQTAARDGARTLSRDDVSTGAGDRNRDPEKPAYAVRYEAEQQEIKERVDAFRDAGDKDGTRISALEQRQHQARFAAAVWTDLAKKEEELQPGSSEAVAYRAFAREAREEHAAIRERHVEETAFQAPSRTPPAEVDVSNAQGLDWGKDPFREDLVRQRQAKAIADLPQGDREQAAAAFKAQGDEEASAWQDRVNYVAEVTKDATPYFREMAEMEFDRMGAWEAGKRWDAEAKAEYARGGNTVAHREALEHRDVASRALRALTHRMNECKEDEQARGGSGDFKLVPPSAQRVSSDRAIGASRQQPPLRADIEDIILQRKRTPEQVRPTEARPATREEMPKVRPPENTPQATQATAKATLAEVTVLNSRIEEHRARQAEQPAQIDPIAAAVARHMPKGDTAHRGPQPPQGTAEPTPSDPIAAAVARHMPKGDAAHRGPQPPQGTAEPTPSDPIAAAVARRTPKKEEEEAVSYGPRR